MLLTGAYRCARHKNNNRRTVGALLNSLIFCVMTLSLLMGVDSTSRWKVVVVAIASIFLNAALRELMPGLFGAVASVFATVFFVGTALVTWCEIEGHTALRILGAYFGFSIVLSVFSTLLTDLPA
jgi:hypothetical protein